MLFIVVAVPVVLAMLSWALTYTSLFDARHIRVEGNQVLSAEQVRTLAGVDEATNTFHLDEDPILDALRSSPWIAEASVRTELPGTLVLIVDERSPVGVITAMGDTGILASDGSLLPGSPGVADGLPIVRAGLGAPSAEQRVAAAALLSALAPIVARQVGEVLVDQDGTVTMTLANGTVVHAGHAGQESVKAEALRGVLRWGVSKGVSFNSIDVSSPAAPSATLTDGSTFTP